MSQAPDGPGHRLRAIYKQAGILLDELDGVPDGGDLVAIREAADSIAQRHGVDLDPGGGDA